MDDQQRFNAAQVALSREAIELANAQLKALDSLADTVMALNLGFRMLISSLEESGSLAVELMRKDLAIVENEGRSPEIRGAATACLRLITTATR